MIEAVTTLVSVKDAAVFLKTTETRILMMLRQGFLLGRMEEDVWMVEQTSLQGCRQPQAADIVRPGGCSGSCGTGCGGHQTGVDT